MQTMIGLALGILASAIVWFVVTRCIVPEIEFLPEITKTPSSENDSGFKYRMRLRNSSRRAIVDLELFAKLRVLGLIPSEPRIWRSLYIPVDDPRIPKLKSHRKTNRRIAVQLLVNSLSPQTQAALPEELRHRASAGTLLLEDLMSLGSSAKLQLVAFGYDEFSGTRKAFESRDYTIEDLQALDTPPPETGDA